MKSNIFTITRLLVFFSLLMFFLSIYSFYISWQTLSWPTTTAKIYWIIEGTKGTTNSIKRPILTTNVNEAWYSYVVEFQEFDGHMPINKENNYTTEDNILIYYNPVNPSQSTIYKGINWVYFLVFISVSIVLALSAYAWHKKIIILTSDCDVKPN